MMNNKVTKVELKKVFKRSFMYGSSWNYERMQNLGFLYTILPVLKKLYPDKDSASPAMKRHLEFFNTHQTAAPFILGVTSAMEEQEGNEGAASITGIKVGLMGPLAGLGDSLFWLTLVPICFSIGASYSKDGGALGIFIALILFNIINIPVKYFGLKYGYTKGSSLIQENNTKGTLNRVTSMATALGLVLVGGLIPSMVGINFGLEFKQGELVISVQEMITKLIPGFIPMALTLLMCKLIRKGKNPVVLIFSVLAIGVILVVLGILK
ncbi:PTS system mannose/fructose/N-acetylgalactosamine-specific transporter subunit IID [Streptococcus pneumoniae]|uniref:PTS system mannose/fructose/sorbose family transporter subunit IID n=1 Tax=Streptococcus pneumoniae TaxID=1313 RepID=UPI000765112B|nr:PTS system mannose/fructose/sorbose family transporter subunit IID [Streptococcus pneumoniae]MDT5500314.1 PTS system mannose/fructose/sorbose family transporter subunit IID [Streptococcus pneumoniae]CVS35682.1 PTS system mannose/fructose/N-acetylgalactosamine-specific transporter subunit IID [Streptococcus pneumoniae]CVZ40141.1 PTS system mannose/fructose/N-acetylgalactosamine-specific transporter subunit IID [Streptococcus pneumoniae]VRU42696.1 PTS system mannose/fructose/N -acetylgalactosa